jgi:hypothetical protein
LILFAGGFLEILNQDVPLSRVLRHVAFSFATATAVMFAVSYGIAAAVATTAQDTSPDTVRMVYGVSGSASLVGSLFLGLFVLTKACRGGSAIWAWLVASALPLAPLPWSRALVFSPCFI